MSINSDIQRSIDNGTIGRAPVSRGAENHPRTISDFEFRTSHGGMTFEQWTALNRQKHAEAIEIDAMRPWTEGAPPGGRTLPGWHGWKRDLEAERDLAISVRDRLLNHVAAPAATQRSLTEAVAAGAKAMLASMGWGSADPKPEVAVDHGQLEARLEAERRAAAEATEALKIVEQKLAVIEKHLAAVRARESEFIRPALRELAEPLGPRLIRQLNDLRETYSLLGALSEEIGGYGHGEWEAFPDLKFARPDLDTTKLCPPDKFKIKTSDESRAFWRSTAVTLAANPKAKVSLPISR